MSTSNAHPDDMPFDMRGAAVAQLDSRGAVRSWTLAAQRLLGHPPERVLHRPFTDLLVDGGGRPGTALRAGDTEGWVGTVEALTARGRRVELGLWTWPVTPHGDGGQLVAAVRTDGRPWWEVNRSTTRRFYRSSPIGTAIVGPDLRLRWVNEALERMTGIPLRDRIGKRLVELEGLPPRTASALEEQVRYALDTGEPVVDFEYFVTAPAHDRREHRYSSSFFRLDDDFGGILGVCYTVLDVSELWRGQERLSLLNAVGAATSSTLDVTDVAQALARNTVPRLADHVTVDLLEPVLDGGTPAPCVRHRPPVLRRAGIASAVGVKIANTAGRRGDRLSCPRWLNERCFVERKSYMSCTHHLPLPGSTDARRTPDAEGEAVMVVPLLVRDRALGVVTFIRSADSEPFEPDDLTFGERVAALSTVNLDNARRYTREHHTALTLQQELLPHDIAPESTLEIGSRYLPSGTGGGVGGDWFDVIPLSGSRTALVVGDVAGHGISAAASMGRLRTAVRTLASLDLTPDEVLARLDDLILGAGTEGSENISDLPALGATCLYVIIDPVNGTCSMGRAGHPPPVLVSPDGDVTVPDLPPGPPLGLGGIPFSSTEVPLPENTVLALFTDGLLESGGLDVDAAMDRLTSEMGRAPDLPLGELVDSVLAKMLPEGERDDDVAVLLARTHALGSDLASWTLPSRADAVATAREVAVERVTSWGLEDLAFNVELTVSELVTNAVRYASGPTVELRLIRQSSLICEVSDNSSSSPRIRHARASEEGGRGLFLVAQLARRWGTRYSEEGKTIWAEQSLTDAPEVPTPSLDLFDDAA